MNDSRHRATTEAKPPVLRSRILDRASVRGLASLPPQDGIRGFGRPISLRVLRSESVDRGRDGLADPVVQIAVVRAGLKLAE